MTFKPRVAVQTAIGRCLFYAHSARATAMCKQGQAIPVTDGIIQLTESTSLGSMRGEHTPKPDAPARRTYHGASVPKQAGRLTWAPRYDKTASGQVGARFRVEIEYPCERRSQNG